MQRFTTSHITLRSSNLKCFNSGSTTYAIASGSSRKSLAYRIEKFLSLSPLELYGQ
jgi:hypothetical protein